MILVKDEIQARGIVRPSVAGDHTRLTTYDASVGDIVIEGKRIAESSFTLKPRGVVWVISKEEFHLPNDVTGLATLRTSWTHRGILAINLGVIDPGWNSHVATAVVNFSRNDFQIRKGDTFFRILFLTHVPTVPQSTLMTSRFYKSEIENKTHLFSKTFLTMDSLVGEVAEKVIGLPKVVVVISFIAIIVEILAIVLPLGWTAFTQNYVMPGRVDALEKAVAALQAGHSGDPAR